MQMNNISSLKDMLDHLSTEQLTAMLNYALDCEPVDENSIRLLMRTLRERENNLKKEISPSTLVAWDRCQEKLASLDDQCETHFIVQKRSWFLRIATAAAVVILLISIVPHQASADAFFDRLFRWTSEVVEFFTHEDDESRFVQYEFKSEHSGLQKVYQAVTETGITEPVVPMWIPDGYKLNELITDKMRSKTRIHARFDSQDRYIVFFADIYDHEVSHKYYKDDEHIIEYEIEGTTYNIMRNLDLWVVIWTVDNIECSITVDCQEEDLYKILGSIYVMEEG